MHRTVITGSGSYIPTEVVTNRDFTVHNFYAEDSVRIETAPQEVVEKFRQITGIAERRYTRADLNTSDIGAIAAKKAIEDSGIDPETLDQIIIDVAFETLEKAKAVLAALQKLWGKVGVVTSVPKTRFIMMVDSMKV